MNCGIYKILNTKNGKVYIGSSMNLRKRQLEHFRYLNRGSHHSILLQRSYIKHGFDNFRFCIVELCKKEKSILLEREQYHMDLYNSYDPKFGYNVRIKANSNAGLKASDETKLKQSLAKLGKSQTLEHRQNVSKALKGREGKIPSLETRIKLSESHKGHVHSDEHKLNIGLSLKGLACTEEKKEKLKKKDKWPCADGSRCKCANCNEKKAAYLRGRRNSKNPRYFKIDAAKIMVLSND